MTTFRTCDTDMIEFIDWLVETGEVNDWAEIRFVLEDPWRYFEKYLEFQEAIYPLEQ